MRKSTLDGRNGRCGGLYGASECHVRLNGVTTARRSSGSFLAACGVLLCILAVPGSVFAVSRVAYLKPVGPGDTTEHQTVVGEPWQAVDEDPHDGDLSYIFHHTGSGTPREAVTTFSMQDSTPAMQTIESATCETVSWQSSASQGESTCATISPGGGAGCGSPTSYTRLFSSTVAGPLLPEELDEIECGVATYCDALICAGREFRTTQVRLRVVYDDGVPPPTPTPTPTPAPTSVPGFCTDWSETEPFTIRSGETRTVPVRVRNCGSATWNAGSDSLNYRGWWSDPGYTKKVDSSALGTPLSEPVPAGATTDDMETTVRAPYCTNQTTGVAEPSPAGTYYLRWDIFRSDGNPFSGFFFSNRYHTALGDLEIQVLEANGDPAPTPTPTPTPAPSSAPQPTVTPTRLPPTPTPLEPCTEDFGSCENAAQGVHPNFDCCSTWCEMLLEGEPGRCVSPPTAPENERPKPPPPQSEPGSAYTHPGGKLSAGAPAAGTCDPESAGYKTIYTCGDVFENVQLGGDLNVIPANETKPNGTCLRPRVDGVTIDGCGHRIRPSTDLVLAVSIMQRSDITVKNLKVVKHDDPDVTSPIQIYGDWADGAVIERSTLGRIVVLGTDDVRIERNVAESIELAVLESASQCEGDECTPQGAVVWSNEISGLGSNVVFRLRGGEGCIRGDHLILDNTFDNTREGSSSGIVFQMLCSTNNTVARNTFESMVPAKTVHLRDSTFNNLFEDNVVHQMVDSGHGALAIQSGWKNSYHPSYNVFRRNDFLIDGAGPAITIQAPCARGNRFEDNVFRNVSDGSGEPGTAYLLGRQNVFRNNTFYRTGPGTILHLEYPTQGAGGGYVESCTDPGEPPNQFLNNIIMSQANGVMIYSEAADKYRGNYNLFYDGAGPAMFQSSLWAPYDFGEWKRRTFQDGESEEGDPRFENAGEDDFRLQAESPAHGNEERGDIGARR